MTLCRKTRLRIWNNLVMSNLNTKQNDVEVFVRDVVVSFSVTGTVARLLLFSCMKKACHDMARQNEWTGKTVASAGL